MPTLAYLSGAPRVSTRPESELPGPRSRVLGTIKGFRELGWEVRPFIVGDQIPQRMAAFDSAHRPMSLVRRLAADAVRITIGHVNALRVHARLNGKIDWMYERLAVFQSLGERLQRRGISWILETNAPLSLEAKLDRQSIALYRLARAREFHAYRRCDALLCVSEKLKEMIVEEAQVSPGKIIVAPSAVDTDLFTPAVNRSARRGVTLVFAGTLFHWQGIELLLQALHELRGRLPEWRLLIIGDGPREPALRRLTSDLGWAARVEFQGRLPQAELISLLSACDLAYSGYSGTRIGAVYGSPLKLYEYMAMGLPVIGSAVPDARRLVRDSENGFLFEAGNVASLRDCLLRAMARRERWPSIGQSAREEVVRSHSWPARVRDMVAQIRAVLAERDPRREPAHCLQKPHRVWQ